MQNDSMHRTFGTMSPNEAAKQESAVSYNCNHCVLIFKTRIYLYEHLHQVHGLDIDAALRDSGLKSLPLSKSKPDNSHKQSDFAFNCKSCNFKSGNWSVYSEHKKQCSGSSNNESPTTKTSILINTHKQSAGAKEINYEKTKRKSNSKDVKIYTKSPQTITKYFTAASAMKSDIDPEDTDTKTLLLEESSLKSCGVFQVTAKSIDMAEGPCNQTYLLTDPTLAKPVDPFKEVAQKNTGKRTAIESAKSALSKKKPKLELDIVPKPRNEIQSSSCAELSFEVSDDEDEQNPVCADIEAIKVYFCKHCEFSTTNLKHIFSHYEDSHPYIRYNSVYIEERSDQTAMFRCLECPVEFLSEAHLRKHYREDHPEAPNVFTLKSSDLNLVYKCFVCPFTSNILHSLREHYKEQHPSHKVENPLMYCKYSSTEHRDHITEMRISEEDNSLETHASERTTTPCKEQKSASATSNPMPKAPDGTLYHCSKCTFSHKSVVVLHVHYKKCHPEEAITLDKIKQSICAPTVISSEEKPVPALDHSYYVVTEESCVSPISDSEILISDSTVLDNASSSHDKKFFCNHCDFSSINIRSVISHHNAKHETITNIQEIVQHTATIESKDFGNMDKSVRNVYACAQDMYYCQVCNYGNPALKGLLNHQIKLHEKIKISKERVEEYTAMIRDQIEKSKSHPTDSILPTGLPLPLIKEHDTMLFFCHFCNYRHKNKTLVMRHYLKVHKGSRITTQEIVEHTSLVYERLNTTCQSKSDGQSQKVSFTNIKKKVYHKKKITKTPKSVPQTQVKLKCNQCSYGAHFLNLMRKHLQKWHKKTMSYSDIVQLCGTGATFQPGYYCDVCSFYNEDLEVATKHGKHRHVGRSVSLKFIMTQMYLSPDVCVPKKKPNSINHYNPDASSATQTSGQKDTETYSCKACSFKGTSLSSITSHYRAVHPWCVKEDGSVLDVSNSSKKQSTSSKMQDHKEYGEAFDSYQVPLEFDNLNVSTEEAKDSYSCSYCPATFEGHGGLLIHLGMKHRDETAEEMPQLEMAKRINIFKCRSCSYVNNIRQGVIGHAHMKHPGKTLKLDSLYIGREHLHNVEKKVKNGMWKFCGYMCKICSQIYSSKEKLKTHRESHHKMSVLNTFSQSSKAASATDGSRFKYKEIWCQQCGLYCASPMELTDHLHVCQKSNIYPCVLCPNAFSTKVRLGIHYTKKHGKKAFFKHYTPLYNQPSKKPKADCAQPEETTKCTVMTESEKVLVYKCPSCRYVNTATHGTLTHCQMRHPNIVVRADTLKTAEIHLANMIGSQSGTGSNHGGYRCKKCPMVYGVLKKLKKHCETDHNPSVRAKQPVSVDDNTVSESASLNQKKSVSRFCHFFKCSLCSYSTLILKQLGSHYTQRHGKSAYIKFYSPLFYQANKKAKTSVTYEETEKTENASKTTTSPVQTKVYKCSICSYGSLYRRYLIAHLRNRHKLDSQAIYKQMEKYNSYKQTIPDGQFTCKKCLSVFFESRGRLLAHYRTFHSSEVKLDFTIIAERKPRTTGVYKCSHCKKKIFGIKNLSSHLDRHRAARLRMMQNLDMVDGKTVEVSEQDPLPCLQTVEEDMKLNVKTQEILTAKTSPPVSPSPPSGPEVPEEQQSEGKHTCLRCKRTFMSLKGLRSHERSHAALAAIKKMDNLSTSVFKEHIEQYLVYRSGTTRPYMCKICSYRTTVMGLWKSHIIKNHQYVLNAAQTDQQIEEATDKDTEDTPNVGEDINALDGDEEPENSYLEPPDVQRQLRHYNVMAQVDPASKTQEIQLSDPRMFPCEMCNFNAAHLSTMRRHYLRRHGKKLIRCKDCNFFTCFRQNLDLHEQAGHSTVQSEPTHQKNLCCPFCLYQSKNKNNMIDHIVLHREERVMPMEVRRSKLSRYLQGIVFRCHKCTFTSGSADSLHLHMTKHNDIKPFKCRLCYFDCTQLRDLEAHLCDKHQVVRNHQLVGQVSLDQLEARDDRISQDEDDKVLYGSQNNEQRVENMSLQNELPNEKKTEDAIIENQTNEHETLKDGAEFMNIPKTQSIFGQSVDERSKNSKDFSEPQLDKEIDENKAQIKAKEEVSESSPVCVKEDPSRFQDNALNADAKVENDILHPIVQLDDKGSSNTVNKALQDKKQIVMTENVDSQNQSSKVDGKPAVATNQKSTVNSEIINAVTKNIIDKSALILPTSIELKISHDVKQDQQRFGAVSTSFNKGHTHNQLNSTDQKNPYGEMPILEKYFKEQHITYAKHCETSEKLPCHREREDCNEESTEVGKHEGGVQKDHNPPELLCTDGAAEVPSPVAATLFTCDLCGRNFANTSELERHIMRHGM